MKLLIKKSRTQDELVKGCLQGEAGAQKELYSKYASKMLSVCMRYIRSKDDAEDVMITGFMKVFEKVGQYSGEGNFEGWMRRIMVNEALMWIRKNKYMYLEVDSELAPPEPNLSLLENHLHEEDLLEMIRKLPEGYRTVFNLYTIEGYSHKEIGEMLGINENTSKSQLSRARVYLQKQLAEIEKNIERKIKSHEPSKN